MRVKIQEALATGLMQARGLRGRYFHNIDISLEIIYGNF